MNTALNPILLQQAKKITAGDHLDTDELNHLITRLARSADEVAIDRVISLYEKNILKFERDIWRDKPTDAQIEKYQEYFKALEKIHELKANDERHHFKIVIPVADRPRLLKQCLESLLTLCKSYQYGGFSNNSYDKISVLIADDSSDENNIRLNQSYCSELTQAGLTTEYFGLAEQLSLVEKLTDKPALTTMILPDIGDIEQLSDFSHKGASIMRNITYLRLSNNAAEKSGIDKTLFFFVDSDQEFCVSTTRSDKQYAINYFHYLHEIFSTQDITMLTGKVVGDPPVSPSVMAGNFQQDIKNYLLSIARSNPEDSCQYHHNQNTASDNSAYHDMADLFGFSNQNETFNYQCTLTNEHDNADCFDDFSDKLNHFFHGEHPTRKTYFHYENGFTRTSAARTVYTGNYILKPEALNYFMPFATLKLRMAGPVLGRLLKSEIKQQFVSANLPMLHNRTITSTGESEFRPGIINHSRGIDLSKEFIRQFYGDVLLFSIDELTRTNSSLSQPDQEHIQLIIKQTYQTIKQKYLDKHDKILRLQKQISLLITDEKNWWNIRTNKEHNHNDSLSNFEAFLNNIKQNFDEDTDAYREFTLPQLSQKHLDRLLHAILHYQDDIDNWKNIFSVNKKDIIT